MLARQLARQMCMGRVATCDTSSGSASRSMCAALPSSHISLIKSGAAARRRGGASRAALSLGGPLARARRPADSFPSEQPASSGRARKCRTSRRSRSWSSRSQPLPQGRSLRSRRSRDRLSPTLDPAATPDGIWRLREWRTAVNAWCWSTCSWLLAE